MEQETMAENPPMTPPTEESFSEAPEPVNVEEPAAQQQDGTPSTPPPAADPAPAAPSPTQEPITKSSVMATNYTLTVLPLGAEVHGLQLTEAVSDAIIKRLKDDVTKHKVLIFRNQGELSGERQISVTEWFGEVETAGFELHDRSPDRRILRVSNDESEGYVGFGTAGFHVDGSFMEKPNTHSIYNMVTAPSQGETFFVSWNDVIKGMCRSKRQLWRRLWMLKTFKRIRGFQEEPGQVIHPLVYKHPVTGQKTMCVSLGKLSRFIMDFKNPAEKKMDKEETESFEADINTEIRRENDKLLYKHKWQNGDVIITDNLAVGHLASNGTQRSRDEIGLRVLHRTVTVGTFRPQDGHIPAKNQACVLQ